MTQHYYLLDTLVIHGLKSGNVERENDFSNLSLFTRVHCATFHQSLLRHELHEYVTPSSRVDSSEKGLMVVMFCSDLPVM